MLPPNGGREREAKQWKKGNGGSENRDRQIAEAEQSDDAPDFQNFVLVSQTSHKHSKQSTRARLRLKQPFENSLAVPCFRELLRQPLQTRLKVVWPRFAA